MIMANNEKDFHDALKKEAREYLRRNGYESALHEPRILDSGNRREFETGAVRDIQEGKGRCDLLPFNIISDYYEANQPLPTLNEDYSYQRASTVFYYIQMFVDFDNSEYLHHAISCADIFEDDATMFLEVSKHFEEGAKKYGENNWQKGIPTHCYIDSAVRHYLKYLRGDTDERHDRAFCWNLLCCAWTCINKPELDDYRKEEKK